MKYVAWTLQVMLALLMAVSGVGKLVTSRENVNPRMQWVEDFTATEIHLIGIAETAGAIGLIVPAATGIVPILTPVAASGISVLMLGAVYTHVRRGEPYTGTLILAALAAILAAFWFRRVRNLPKRHV